MSEDKSAYCFLVVKEHSNPDMYIAHPTPTLPRDLYKIHILLTKNTSIDN